MCAPVFLGLRGFVRDATLKIGVKSERFWPHQNNRAPAYFNDHRNQTVC